MPLATILTLVQVLEPQIASVVMMIKDRNSGKLTILALLDSVEAQERQNQEQIAAWLSSHKA